MHPRLSSLAQQSSREHTETPRKQEKKKKRTQILTTNDYSNSTDTDWKRINGKMEQKKQAGEVPALGIGMSSGTWPSTPPSSVYKTSDLRGVYILFVLTFQLVNLPLSVMLSLIIYFFSLIYFPKPQSVFRFLFITQNFIGI